MTTKPISELKKRRSRSGSAHELIDNPSALKNPSPCQWRLWGGGILPLAIATVYSVPDSNDILPAVWWYGWLTAICTGIGSFPFLFLQRLDRFWLGISNGLAGGMMLTASGCLLWEGFHCTDVHSKSISPFFRSIIGFGIGIYFIRITKVILDKYENLKLGSLDGMDTRKVFLIMGVMTLHSFSEGVGMGVSFGGKGGENRGILISTTLAIHNIPEGLAVSLVLVPRGLSVLHAFLWSVVSSMPQPVMAVLAYLFVDEFLIILPVGLGFAAGAMSYVACVELIPEAVEDTSNLETTIMTVLFSSLTMLFIQVLLKSYDD